MNDLISRQKLLTELDRYIDAHQGHGFENVRVILRGLKREIIDFPCVQPQQTCEYWDSESKFCALCRPSAQPEKRTEERTETHACDCVERQAAIDALWKIRQEEISDGRRFHDYCSLSTAVDVIKDLPSAQSGKWIWSEDNASWCCSICGCVFEEIDWKPEYNYCPNCGADMRGEK